MKKYILLPCILTALIFTSSFSQSKTYYEEFVGKENLKFGVQVNHNNYLETYNTTAAGIIIEASGNRFGVSYAGRIGLSSTDQFYAYTGVGQVAGFYLLKSGNSVLGIIGIIGMLIPESFIVYSYPTSKSRLGFYLSPWGVEQRGFILPEAETKVSIEAGVKYCVKVSGFYLEPFLGAKAIYKTDRQGVSAGINFFFTK